MQGIKQYITKPYRLVIFDWEGTLRDTLGDVFQCILQEAQALHLGELNTSLVRDAVGLGLPHALKKLFPTLSLMQHQQLLAAVQYALISKQSTICMMPGAEELVKALVQQGVTLAIASNKAQRSLEKALRVSGLEPYFTVIRTASQSPPKPCPQMLEDILEVLAIPVQDALMVGDSVTDIEMARQAGMDAVGMDRYQQATSSLLQAGAMAVFEDLPALRSFLTLSSKD